MGCMYMVVQRPSDDSLHSASPAYRRRGGELFFFFFPPEYLGSAHVGRTGCVCISGRPADLFGILCTS